MSRRAAQRLSNVPKKTVWSEMTPLAIEYKAINLGQGFPNMLPPQFVRDNTAAVMQDPEAPLNHQYCRSLGHISLAKELQTDYQPRLGREIKETEILVTDGVTQGLNLCAQAFINEGDEVVSFEPFFDLYSNDIEMAGGKMVLVEMSTSKTSANEWKATEEQIRAAITPKTKAILINTPQNVPGKVWSMDELEMVAKIAKEHDLLVFSDEVYTTLVYGGLKHISIGSLPGMFERTITMCSAGKTFSCTGWKIGWAVAPAELIVCMNQVASFQSFCISTPLQIGVAKSLAQARDNGYYADFLAMYEKKRATLIAALESAGLPVVSPAGGFFALADISNIDPVHYVDPNETEVGKDWQFCRWLTKEIKVNAIPTTAFTSAKNRPKFEMFVRFAFCKDDRDIEEGGRRLKRLSEFMKK